MVIKANDFILIKKDQYFRSLKLNPDSVENIDGIRVSLGNAIGLPYGTVFAVNGAQIEPVSVEETTDEVPSDTVSGTLNEPVEAKDNRDIVDCTLNQKLDYEDIKMLQSTGSTAHEIVTELVKGNANFDKKTKFSQEKYLKKKRKRYLGLFSIERPCTRILCELYSKLRRDKCLGLRFDTLCHILTYANVHAGSTVLLAETCAGLVLGGVLERLGPVEFGGSVIQFFHGSAPPRPEMNPVAAAAYDLQVNSIAFRDVVGLLTTDLESLLGSSANSEPLNDHCVSKFGALQSDHTGEPTSEMDHSVTSTSESPENGCEQAAASADGRPCDRRLIRQAKRRAGFEKLLGPGANPPDALIVATRFHPVDLTLILMQFLPLGKPVVVYSQFLQPLVDLYNALKQRGGVTHLRLTDNWFRVIQVLPERTHPEVSMLASGGYLLCAYTVEPKPGSLQELLDSGLVSSAFWDDYRGPVD